MSRKQREKRAKARDTKSTTTSPSPPSAPTVGKTSSGGSVNRVGVIVSVIGIVGLFGLVIFLGDPPPAPPPQTAASPQTDDQAAEDDRTDIQKWQAAFLQEVPTSDRDFSRGPADAPVRIVEFSDFECPFCKRADASIKTVLDRYPDDVRLVYKNFPLDMACNSDMARQLHPFACKAAVMARCAGATSPQLFWRFHDAVFESEDLSEEGLNALASSLGLSGDAFDRCVNGTEAFDEVRRDVELARKLGVSATPTLFVNGRAAPSYEADSLSEIIDFILSNN